MTNNPYPTILPPIIGILFSLTLNFAAPVVAYRFSVKLKRHRWWPHAIACLWEVSSLFIFAVLLLPKIPSDESPGPGDGLLVVPTALSAALILLGYCIALLWKFLRFMLTLPHDENGADEIKKPS